MSFSKLRILILLLPLLFTACLRVPGTEAGIPAPAGNGESFSGTDGLATLAYAWIGAIEDAADDLDGASGNLCDCDINNYVCRGLKELVNTPQALATCNQILREAIPLLTERLQHPIKLRFPDTPPEVDHPTEGKKKRAMAAWFEPKLEHQYIAIHRNEPYVGKNKYWEFGHNLGHEVLHLISNASGLQKYTDWASAEGFEYMKDALTAVGNVLALHADHMGFIQPDASASDLPELVCNISDTFGAAPTIKVNQNYNVYGNSTYANFYIESPDVERPFAIHRITASAGSFPFSFYEAGNDFRVEGVFSRGGAIELTATIVGIGDGDGAVATCTKTIDVQLSYFQTRTIYKSRNPNNNNFLFSTSSSEGPSHGFVENVAHHQVYTAPTDICYEPIIRGYMSGYHHYYDYQNTPEPDRTLIGYGCGSRTTHATRPLYKLVAGYGPQYITPNVGEKNNLLNSGQWSRSSGDYILTYVP